MACPGDMSVLTFDASPLTATAAVFAGAGLREYNTETAALQ